MSKPITVKFWGVRGSHPVPGETTIRYGGNTACVEVSANGQTIILDAGTGIIPLGKDLVSRCQQSGKLIQAVLLFSHLHHDHIQGFPFFTPAYMPAARLFLFGPGDGENGVEVTLTRTMTPPAFPVAFREMRASKWIRSLNEDDIIWVSESVGGVAVRKTYENPPDQEAVSIRVLRSLAHPGGVLIYRIEWAGKSVVYATDTEGYVGMDQRLVNFARGANLLIHDAQYTDEHYHGRLPGTSFVQGYGHSTATMACEVAREAGVEQLVLFHHDPGYDDAAITQIEVKSRQLFSSVQAAYEDMVISLSVRSLSGWGAPQPVDHQPSLVAKGC